MIWWYTLKLEDGGNAVVSSAHISHCSLFCHFTINYHKGRVGMRFESTYVVIGWNNKFCFQYHVHIFVL